MLAIGLEVPVEERGELLEALAREVELGRTGDALELLGSDALDIHALLAQVVEGHEAGAAAEQDVRASRPAMLVAMVTALLAGRPGHELRLALVILGVEDVVLDAALVEDAESLSEFSMETVPTRQGWPWEWRSATSSATALNLLETVRYTRSSWSTRMISRASGMTCTGT